MLTLKPLSEHQWNTKVATYDVDGTCRLTPAAQLRLQQEVGERYMEAIGFPYPVMRDRAGACFVITRLNAVLHRRPVLEESIVVSTWCQGLSGIQYRRCYRIESASGELLTDATALIAVVDVERHTLLRPDKLKGFDQFRFCQKSSTASPPAKLRLPAAMSLVGSRRVRYSDIDFNGHMNNTVYASILCDFLPGGMYRREIGGFSIQYNAEAVEGDEITIQAAQEEDAAYIMGSTQRGVCFSARCTFKADGKA